MLGLLDALADCARRHTVLLGDLRVGQPAVEVVGHQLLDTSLPEPHQEAALLEVCPWFGWPASSHRRLRRALVRHQRVAVSGVGLQDLRIFRLLEPSVAIRLPGVCSCSGEVAHGGPNLTGAQCTRVGTYWTRGGCTPWGAGVRAVRTTPGQYRPRLGE